MEIKNCPKCGSLPKITELPLKKKRRQRMCRCPNLCTVLNGKFYFTFIGDGDDYKIYKIWNETVDKI